MYVVNYKNTDIIKIMIHYKLIIKYHIIFVCKNNV